MDKPVPTSKVEDGAFRASLLLHPGSVSPARSVEVRVARAAGCLRFRFTVIGNMSGLCLPLPGKGERADGLWKHSCFEAFVRNSGASSYLEFNFAPCGDWAAYHFDDYRSGMRAADLAPPAISMARKDERFQLEAIARIEPGIGLDPAAAWDMNLSAVIEDQTGARSFWALAHPPGAPDFHQGHCFQLQVPPASGA